MLSGGYKGSVCVELLEASHSPSVLLGTGTWATPDGRPYTWSQPAQLLFRPEQRWQRKWSRWRGHRVLSPASLAREWLGEGEVPASVLRRHHHACPKWGGKKDDTSSSPLAKQHSEVPGVWVICSPTGAKQCVPRKGCSWVLATEWGQGGKKGIRGSELLSSLLDGATSLAGPHYSRATTGLIGEVAPELSLPPAASFSFLPLYWPMKEPSSLNWTSTLPP